MEGPLDADAVTTARVRDALARHALGAGAAGRTWALARERAVARHLEDRYPGLGKLVLAAHEFHRRSARLAVSGGTAEFPVPPAAGIIFTGTLPVPGLPLHALAAGAAPGARFVYCAPDERITDVNAAELAAPDPGRIAAVTARSLDPEAVLGAAPSSELLAAGPVGVQVVLSPSRWPPEMAAEAVAGYARLLPPGSTLCLSLITFGPGSPGEQMTEDSLLAGGRSYVHSSQDVEGWLKEAGMILRPDGARAVPVFAPRVPAVVIGTAGTVPG